MLCPVHWDIDLHLKSTLDCAVAVNLRRSPRKPGYIVQSMLARGWQSRSFVMRVHPQLVDVVIEYKDSGYNILYYSTRCSVFSRKFTQVNLLFGKKTSFTRKLRVNLRVNGI